MSPFEKKNIEIKDPINTFLTKNTVNKNLDSSSTSNNSKNKTSYTVSNYDNLFPYQDDNNEDFNKKGTYSINYNKFNKVPSNKNNSNQHYFNNRNLNYNRYSEESSMIMNNYYFNYNFNFNNNFNILQNIENKSHNFYFQLHNELLEYSNSINGINLLLKEIKLYSISYVENIIKQAISKIFQIILDCQIIIDIYGSFATDLCIESSDIDLTVRILDPTVTSSEEIFVKLLDNFQKLKVFETVNPIFTASVPILKLVKLILIFS